MMRKRLAIVLVFMLFISMLQVPVRAEDNPGPLTAYKTSGEYNYNYVIDGDVSINEPVQIGAGDVVRRINVTSDGAITISSGGVLNLENVSLTVTTGGSITGEGTGLIVLQGTDTEVFGISFYGNLTDPALVSPTGTFRYNSGKWVLEPTNNQDPGGGPQPPESDGTARFVTVIPSDHGQISRVIQPEEGEGDPTITPINAQETIEVIHMDPLEFMIKPDAGYMVAEVRVTVETFAENQSFLLSYNGDGTFQLPFDYINDTQSVQIIYAPITESRLTELLYQTYAVLAAQTGSTGEIQASLANQWGQYGFPVPPGNVAIAAGSIDISGMATQEYGTFRYTLTLAGITMPEHTGYILPSDDVVAFRVYGTHNGAPVDTVRVANQDEYDANEIEVPIVDDGYLDIFAYGNVMAFPMNSALADSMVNGKTPLPFYVAQFHITSFMTGVNLYGFYVIQEDAYCVNVDARSGNESQRALTWEFGRYANLTTGDETSEVFFGNDTFELSLPGNDIGAATSLEVETGDFQGYTVTDNEDGTYSVQFLSDFYDRVSLNVTINGSIARTLHVHRVGVDIELYEADGPEETQGTVGHGTQGGTGFSYEEGGSYQLYASYYIPDWGEVAPYGLYVTYTWQNGTTTTEIITEPCNSPEPFGPFEFVNGVFFFPEKGNTDLAAAVDYLLYAAPDGSNAPIRVNVTVLKDDPTAAGSFGGVFLGSGRGVEWTADN